ncbi:diguanylate cyclase [Desulfovibrio sp. OttesenSCG-928-F07]|nr:diguanylate cyclase [Desulfovibrio sp. OttesenSCG-928-F07]
MFDNYNKKDTQLLLLEHISALLNSPSLPELPAELANDEFVTALHNQLVTLREIVVAFATGEVSKSIQTRGYVAGNLKDLQAHLRHLVWQVQQVERGDYTQRVSFLGDFSSSFNNMVIKLEKTLNDLKRSQDKLREKNKKLRSEVITRTSALETLQEDAKRLDYLAGHDPLTGAMNRRFFMEQAISAYENSVASGKPCSFIMMDIDHFKQFNDTAGHLAGDEALKHIARIADDNLRLSDIMGRYGGEEFIFCLPSTSGDVALDVANRIRALLTITPLSCEGGNQYFTASFGVAEGPVDVLDINDTLVLSVIARADTALYKAKAAGRNSVVMGERVIDGKDHKK